ncbi:MAG TPA: family 78 glycoside hydrolase catalytic domain, partial [Chitinophagaceae bacterium]|nr:family 78 glycoside hydrolase catalytic domain [Chitinophagaceae bacterium]
GRKVTLRFAETLQSNGELATANLRDAKVTDVYTLKGEGEEVWQPSFTYHGFRYVEITNYPGQPLIEDFSGMVVYDDLRTTGHFHTSNSLINKIYQNAFWGVSGNYKGIPVDCPQRNERMPWLGDRAVSSYSESFIFDNANLYEQCLNNIEQSQTEKGVIPDVAPAFWKYYTDDITWPSTYFQVADMLYHQYGEVRPIKKHYSSMKKWVNHIREKYMDHYLIPKDKYGDWCMPPKHIELIHAKDSSRITNGTLLATAYYYHILRLMNKFAGLLNKPSDAKHYEQLAEKIRKAFNQKYLDKNTGEYDNNTVTANLLPLYFGITPDRYKDKVFKNMTDQIVSVYDKHISTGTLGTQMIMRGLTRFGRPDLAYSIVSTKTYPGWGYMVENGATTIWELWNGNKANQWMSSRNHVMLLGDLVVWLYEDVAGIRSDDENPGYKRIIMKPMITDSLQYVNASYHSIHGLIKSDWHKTNHSFHWTISIPGNTSAIVSIPSKSAQTIQENGENISKVKGVKLLKKEKGFVTLKVGSGNYSFKSAL